MEEMKRNMCISDILSRAFNLCKDNFVEIIKVIGVFFLPGIIMQIIINKVVLSDFSNSLTSFLITQDEYYIEEAISNLSGESIIILGLVYLFITILQLFGYLVIMKMLDSANKSEEVSWVSAIKYVFSKLLRIIGLNILVNIMLIITIIVITILSIIITIVTFFIGLIAIIPLWIILGIILMPITYLFTSTLIVGDFGVMDSIKETFRLFRRGYFWSTIGKLITISCIYIGVAVAVSIISMIPIIGYIVSNIGVHVILIYFLAYLNIFVLDRIKPDIYNFGEDNIDNNNSGENFIDPII